jgi:SAM-dependent methyltransferase
MFRRSLTRLTHAVKRSPAARRALTPLLRLVEANRYTGPVLSRLARSMGNGAFDPAGFVRSGQGPHAGVRNLIRYATHSGSAYAGAEFPAGYHTLSISGEVLVGQRDPSLRIELMQRAGLPVAGLRVLDIGANQGGVSFAALDAGASEVVGVDFDHRMVNAANRIAHARGDGNRASFYTFDIDKDPHDLLEDMLPDEGVDLTLLLSVCAWVDDWPELLSWVSQHSRHLLFESNGSERDQLQQRARLEELYATVTLVKDDSSDDDRAQRRLYLCADPK